MLKLHNLNILPYKALNLGLLLLSLSALSCHADRSSERTSILSQVDEKLQGFLFLRYKEFEISEVFERDRDSKNLAERVFQEVHYPLIHAESRELYFKALDESSFTHLGMLVVTFASERDADAALQAIDSKGFFSNTKILTRYFAWVDGVHHVVVYSESSASQDALDFMQSVVP